MVFRVNKKLGNYLKKVKELTVKITKSDLYKKTRRRLKGRLKKFVRWDPVHRFTSYLLHLYVKFVIVTSKKVYLSDRKKYVDYIQNNKPVIHLTWHGRLLSPAIIIPGNLRKKYSVVASRHKDGQYAGELMEFFNFGNIKGSSADPKKSAKQKGGLAAARKMISELKADRGICLTPDGPRGPKHKIQSESLNIAKISGGASVIPFLYSSTRAIKLNTWDEFLLPLPFGKIHIFTGEPIVISKKTTKEELDRITKQLEVDMNQKIKELDKLTGK